MRQENKTLNEGRIDFESVARAFQEEWGIEVEQQRWDTFSRKGIAVESLDGRADNGESEWLVFESEDDALLEATLRVTQDLEEEPEIFNQSFLMDFVFITDTDRHLIAGEEADFRVEDMDEDDILLHDNKLKDYEDTVDERDQAEADADELFGEADELEEEVDDLEAMVRSLTRSNEEGDKEKANELLQKINQLKSEADDKREEAQTLMGRVADIDDELENMVDESRQRVWDDIYEEWYDGLENPIEFLVNEQGIYSMRDIMDQNFISIDINKAAESAVATDGVAHFLDQYDGEEEELTDPKKRKTYYVYGTN